VPPARGALGALASLTKFAPSRSRRCWRRTDCVSSRPPSARAPRRVPARVRVTAALLSIPAIAHDSLHTIYERTIAYQANRGSPFSVWGLYGGLGVWQQAVQAGAVALALALAVIPRRADLIGLAAAAAAVIIATQLGIEHWFYLYIPWFFGLVMLALLGRFSEPAIPEMEAAEASGSARSSRLAVA